MARDKEKRSCGQRLAEWRAFVWDPRSRQFLGRTGTSWGLILLFYLIFYGFLAGLFALTMWVMLQSVDPHVPKYQDRLATPGAHEGGPLSQTWRHYVRALHQFLERECTGRGLGQTGRDLGGDQKVLGQTEVALEWTGLYWEGPCL
uniref:Sodium/potassium-transporting ATPase subunit beta-2 n=1 Tax=Accipiter nisus TaxID=211598 RepID=A0A8B9N5F1_9AVES